MESWSTVHARRADRAACTSAGMPGNGYSGRANNLEVLTDPYGGYDVPGPYGVVICGMSAHVLCYRIAGAAAFSGCMLMLTRGHVAGYANDPYDGDWALGPLGGKALRTQNLYTVKPAEEPNIWGEEPMGTNSLFMPRMTESDVRASQQAKAAAMQQQANLMKGQPPVPDWVGTNQAFFGAHQGGDSSFSSQPQAKVPRHATSKHSRPRPQFRKMKTAHTQQLFRSEEPGVAEYGLEGDNILNEEVLPSEVGTGGPVIGVDGVPSNGEHEWIHYDEPLDFACDPSILGCEDGLEVENYAEN